tara:strand:- start:1681 stop:2217 length:537 start_codon:yes stop_codon:yes gene_type:complete
MKNSSLTGGWFFAMLLPMLALAADCISVEVNRAPAPSKISLSDRKAIMDLISSYGHTWDNKDAKGWTGLFTEDAVWLYRAGGELKNTIHSRTARLNFANEKLEQFAEQGIQTRHLQSNTLLTRKADGSIHGETIFMVPWQTTGESAPRLIHTGVYRDTFVKTKQGWKFSRREVHVDHE